MTKRASPRTRTPVTSRPSRHVRDAMERRGEPTSQQRRFARRLRDQGFLILAMGSGKIAGGKVVPRVLVCRPAQPAITVWAYGHGKWVAVVDRGGTDSLTIEADTFEEVEDWYYEQVIGVRQKSDRFSEEETEDRGFTYRDKRRVTA